MTDRITIADLTDLLVTLGDLNDVCAHDIDRLCAAHESILVRLRGMIRAGQTDAALALIDELLDEVGTA